jgi:hypothetical protein
VRNREKRRSRDYARAVVDEQRPLQERKTAGEGGGSGLGREHQLVAGLDVEVADLTGGQFQDAMNFHADGGEAPGAKAFPGAEDAEVFVEGDNVDGKAHPHGVDPGGGANEDAGAVIEGRFSEKAEQSRQKGVSEADPRADGYGLLRNGDGKVLH